MLTYFLGFKPWNKTLWWLLLYIICPSCVLKTIPTHSDIDYKTPLKFGLTYILNVLLVCLDCSFTASCGICFVLWCILSFNLIKVICNLCHSSPVVTLYLVAKLSFTRCIKIFGHPMPCWQCDFCPWTTADSIIEHEHITSHAISGILGHNILTITIWPLSDLT